jgi:hypothetical protein
VAVMTALPMVPGRSARPRRSSRTTTAAVVIRARQSGLRLGRGRCRGAPVRGGVADPDQGRHAAAVAAAFAVKPAMLRRWESRCSDAVVAGLLTEHNGPKRQSKLTPDRVAAIRRLRGGPGVLPDGRRHRGGVGGQCPQRAQAYRHRRRRRRILRHNRSRCPTAVRVRVRAAAAGRVRARGRGGRRGRGGAGLPGTGFRRAKAGDRGRGRRAGGSRAGLPGKASAGIPAVDAPVLADPSEGGRASVDAVRADHRCGADVHRVRAGTVGGAGTGAALTRPSRVGLTLTTQLPLARRHAELTGW